MGIQQGINQLVTAVPQRAELFGLRNTTLEGSELSVVRSTVYTTQKHYNFTSTSEQLRVEKLSYSKYGILL